MHRHFALLLLALYLTVAPCLAGEEALAFAQARNGENIAYALNTASAAPKYVVILFPGGNGLINPHLEDGKLVYGLKGNFLLRSRHLLVDGEFASVMTNSSPSVERIQALLDDLKTRFPQARIYLMGTSNGTFDTLALAGYLSERIAGEIHTSSLRRIATFDPKQYKNRHLIVHHRDDGCHATPFAAAQWSHEKYGSELIAMEGGNSQGNPCEAFAHHGYNGIEGETIAAIKAWIKRGEPVQAP